MTDECSSWAIGLVASHQHQLHPPESEDDALQLFVERRQSRRIDPERRLLLRLLRLLPEQHHPSGQPHKFLANTNRQEERCGCCWVYIGDQAN
jgi:hypothetical protein